MVMVIKMFKVWLVILIPIILYSINEKVVSIKTVKSSIKIGGLFRPSKILIVVSSSLVFFGLGYLFYRDVIISTVISVIGVVVPKGLDTIVKKKKVREYKIQFREALYNLSSVLQAGTSLENSFYDCINNLIFTCGENSMIVAEFKMIVDNQNINKGLENSLALFKARVPIEEIELFVDLVIIARKRGGNIVDLIKSCNILIAEKIRTEEEIRNMIWEKRFEYGVMFLLPIAMITMLSLCAAGYIVSLFTTITGKIAVSIAILLWCLSSILAYYILDIEV